MSESACMGDHESSRMPHTKRRRLRDALETAPGIGNRGAYPKPVYTQPQVERTLLSAYLATFSLNRIQPEGAAPHRDGARNGGVCLPERAEPLMDSGLARLTPRTRPGRKAATLEGSQAVPWPLQTSTLGAYLPRYGDRHPAPLRRGGAPCSQPAQGIRDVYTRGTQ